MNIRNRYAKVCLFLDVYKRQEVVRPSNKVVLKSNYKLFPGVNFFWISLQMKKGTSLYTRINSELCAVKVDGRDLTCKYLSPKNCLLYTSRCV